jgi:hypothetical protein
VRGGVRAAIAICALTSCVRGPLDVETRFPALERIRGHHLDEATPYFWPRDGSLALFFCRWPEGSEIPVALPVGATADETRAIEAALRTWEGAGLGIRFRRVAPGEEQLSLLLADESVPTAVGEGVGSSIVDCRLDGDPGAVAGGVLDAEITNALVRIARRTPKDFRGRDKLLGPEQQTGIALHEIGHALGFQGHVSSGDTSMILSRDDVTARGRAALKGERPQDPTLRALYSLPSGAVIRRVPLPPARTEAVDRLAEVAARGGLRGPFVRVGDRDGRVFWRDSAGEEYGVTVADVKKLLREPEGLVLLPEPAARVLISAGSAP